MAFYLRRREALQPRRDIRRLTEHRTGFAVRSGPQVTDHRNAGVDADPHVHLWKSFGRKPIIQIAHGREDRETCPYCAKGVVLLRHRIAEIHQETVAEEPRDRAAEALDRSHGGFTIRYDGSTEVFGVQHPRQPCRVDEIAEHDGDLSAFRACGGEVSVVTRGGRWHVGLGQRGAA